MLRSAAGMRWQRFLGLAVMAIAMACGSCSYFDAVPNVDVCAQGLVGYEVRVTTLQGRTLEFLLIDVTGDAVVGEFHIVPFDEIRTLERKRVDPWKTIALLTGFAAGFATATLLWLWTMYEW